MVGMSKQLENRTKEILRSYKEIRNDDIILTEESSKDYFELLDNMSQLIADQRDFIEEQRKNLLDYIVHYTL